MMGGRYSVAGGAEGMRSDITKTWGLLSTINGSNPSQRKIGRSFRS
jgi:hypothetical protein